MENLKLENFFTFETEIGGKNLILETGRLGKQAAGAVVVRHADNVVLVTACVSPAVREGIDFFPLVVDYEERMYAAGKIPGGFFKREGRPSEKEILRSRLIDRSIRPLFPSFLRNDVQIIAKVLAADPNYPPDIAAMIGASAALAISPIPFFGPIGAVRIGYINDKFIVNPSYTEIEEGQLDLIVAATEEAIIMVEAGAKEVPEDLILEGLQYAHQEIKQIISLQKSLVNVAGKPKLEIEETPPSPELLAAVDSIARAMIKEAIRTVDKKQREEALAKIDEEVRAKLSAEFPDQDLVIQEIERKILKEETRKMILEEGIRPDGRRLEEIRPVSCEVGILPRVHGCGIFTRGQTQVLTILTLGAIGEVQIIEGLGIEEYKRYMHHYNFPPFSTGEVRPLRGPGRREIGHGALAERALLPVIPSQEDFPYTIRLVSEVLESNGSTSMASVCGSTLALMDAGVPIKTPIAGIAMGLIKEGERVAVLTDIQGMEDALGDMDFKVAGSDQGITALQMDMKIQGINLDILREALSQARKARLFILEKIKQTISAPRPELSPNAPRVLVMDIDTDKIKDVIGPGGKVIKKIIEETGAVIDIEQTGRVFITAPSAEACEKAKKQIELLVGEVEIGGVYMGKVTRLATYGAFIEIAPGKEGLLHISQISDKRIGKIEDLFKVGDQVLVKVIKIDEQHRIGLSRKGLPDSLKAAEEDKGKKGPSGKRG